MTLDTTPQATGAAEPGLNPQASQPHPAWCSPTRCKVDANGWGYHVSDTTQLRDVNDDAPVTVGLRLVNWAESMNPTGDGYLYLRVATEPIPVVGIATVETSFTVDAAGALSDRMADLVATARGAKRARDLLPDDVIVWEGVEHTVIMVMLDSTVCQHEHDGCCGPWSVAIETDLSGEGNLLGGRTFDPDEMFPVMTCR